MLTMPDYFNEIQRYQRGFGNRRTLIDYFKNFYPEEDFHNEEILFYHPIDSQEQTEFLSDHQQPSNIYQK